MYARTTHASLIARLTDREDAMAWNEFLERYGALLRGFARRRGLSVADTDDVVQDVVAALVGALPQFHYDPARGRFRGYLKTIAVRAIQRRICQSGRAGPLLDAADAASDGAPEQEAEWESEWRQYHLRLAMRSIEVEFGPIDRMAFQRYAVEGMGARETAESLGVSVDQVYQSKSRIVRRLGELIEAQVAEEG